MNRIKKLLLCIFVSILAFTTQNHEEKSDQGFIWPLLAFDVLVSNLTNNNPKIILNNSTKYPLFVTWQFTDGKLRGCIGTFEKYPLSQGVSSFALKSAFEDKRFPPISSMGEVKILTCKVSLLYKFEPIKDLYDWKDGIHGLEISFYVKGNMYHSTFLPHVSTDYGWTPDETINNLIIKSEYKGIIDEPLKRQLHMTRYQAKIYQADYKDYEAYINNEVSQAVFID